MRVFLLLFLFILFFSSCGMQSQQKVLIAGHRGYPAKFPENTLPSFAAAIKGGADAIEFDIQMSKDGVPVIMHDRTLDRTTNGRGPVENLTLQELQSLDAASSFHHRVSGYHIPTLAQVLKLARESHMLIYPEIKGYRSSDDIKIMLKMIIDAGYEDKAVVESFNYEDFKVVRSISKKIKIAYMAETEDQVDRTFKESESDKMTQLFVLYFLLYDTSIIETAHQAHIPVMAWTVNHKVDFDILRHLGVDGVITDDLGTMKRRQNKCIG